MVGRHPRSRRIVAPLHAKGSPCTSSRRARVKLTPRTARRDVPEGPPVGRRPADQDGGVQQGTPSHTSVGQRLKRRQRHGAVAGRNGQRHVGRRIIVTHWAHLVSSPSSSREDPHTSTSVSSTSGTSSTTSGPSSTSSTSSISSSNTSTSTSPSSGAGSSSTSSRSRGRGHVPPPAWLKSRRLSTQPRRHLHNLLDLQQESICPAARDPCICRLVECRPLSASRGLRAASRVGEARPAETLCQHEPTCRRMRRRLSRRSRPQLHRQPRRRRGPTLRSCPPPRHRTTCRPVCDLATIGCPAGIKRMDDGLRRET